jgi:alkylation response protein AidB-like acyl-CoA dehydrogenase
MIDLRLSSEQADFVQAIVNVARRSAGDRLTTCEGLWKGLAEVGVLGVCSPDTGGTPLDLIVAMETLGQIGCGGPVVATCAAAAMLRGDDLESVVSGDRLVTFTDGTLVPWGDSADFVLGLSATGAWLMAVEDLRDAPTLSGERWSVGRTRQARDLGEPGPAVRLAELGLSSYLLGAALEMVARAADYARQRIQFGRPIGDFQAVAHPLARSHAELRSTQELVRMLSRLAVTGSDNELTTRCRIEASRVACAAAERAHQAVGAMGFALETGLAAISMQIRQWSTLPVTCRFPA